MKEIQQQIRQGIKDMEMIVGQLEAWRDKYGYYDKSARTDAARHAFYMLLKELRESVAFY
jgi:hypothetical protein